MSQPLLVLQVTVFSRQMPPQSGVHVEVPCAATTPTQLLVPVAVMVPGGGVQVVAVNVPVTVTAWPGASEGINDGVRMNPVLSVTLMFCTVTLPALLTTPENGTG